MTLPEFQPAFKTALAIDWDTDHSLALAPERTAWLVHALGFHGRVNSYTGALWFYELNKPGHRYASGTITFSGTPQWSEITEVRLDASSIQHVNLIGDTAESVAKCVELLINAGSTGVWAQAEGSVLTITAREMGDAGNRIAFWAGTGGGGFAVQTSGPTLSGGTSGVWRTDLTAMPRLNRAARDWNRSFFRALKGYGMESTAAFSMELQHGDDAPAVGIAQRYPDGAVWLSTPALQTNFGPVSTAFWRQTYRDMADVMAEAGVSPYLQFGEVQWWYFASKAGMPFYDDHATSEFLRRYGRPMAVIPSERSDPGPYSQECAFLQSLIGEFTAAIMAYVRQTQPGVRFEVLYPPDVNDTALNRTVNYPTEYWTPTSWPV